MQPNKLSNNDCSHPRRLKKHKKGPRYQDEEERTCVGGGA